MSLPKHFPIDQLSAANRRKLEWYYRRYVEEFYPEYRFGHFLLTAYAAVPALLTPDLMYKLWQNFHQYQWAGRTERIHRVAVSDLLLSPLCREIGFEVYEMEPSIRQAFLDWQTRLSDDPLWQDRHLAPIKSIADFLQEYHARPNPARQRWGGAYEEVQEWNTLAFLQPARLQQRMWQKLQQSIARNQETETLRVLDFWSKSENQLAMGLSDMEQEQWRQNAQFAQAWKALLQHNSQLFTQLIAEDETYLAMLDDNPEGGVAVKMPAKVKAEVDRIREAAKPEEKTEERVFALLVGIDQYARADLPRLEGCQNDVADFQALLGNATDYLGMPLETMLLVDREATIEQVQSSLRNVVNELQDGDHFVFFFAGNSANSLGRDLWERDGTLYLYDSEPIKAGWSGMQQGEIEELLVNLIQEKKVNCLLVLDHAKLAEDEGSKANIDSFRDHPLYFKGSLVILYGAEGNQTTYERTFGQEKRGVFPFALSNVFRDKGYNISFRNLMDTTRLRMTQLIDQQTPAMEAFPTEMSNAFILAHEVFSGEKEYEVSFDPNQSQYVLNAGVRQGITPSLEYMATLIRLEDGRELTVGEVYRDHATLRNFTGDGDPSRIYSAKLLQTALPKIQVAFDPGIDEKMEAQLRSVIQSYDIYYIDIRNKLEDAQYFIHSWRNDYFLSRQISNRETNSGGIRPLFNLEPDPFELIKQMEYIAQWSGVVEYQNPNSKIDSRDFHIRIGLVEGQRLTTRNLNNVEPDRLLENPTSIEVAYSKEDSQSQGGPFQKGSGSMNLSYQSTSSDDRMLQPGLQISLRSEIKQLIYINVLYLDSNYGIEPSFRSNAIEPGMELPVPFTLRGETYRTIPLNFDVKNLDLGKSEIYDYLKIFLSTEPLDIEPLQQESLELDKQAERTVIVRRQQDRGTFTIGETDWTAITIPIKIKYQQTTFKDPWDAPAQQQTKSPSEEEIYRSEYSGSEPQSSRAINPEELQVARDMVAKGELKRAVEMMQRLTRETDSENEILLLAARLNSLERDNQKGVLSNEDYNLSRNRITYALLDNIRLLDSNTSR